MGASRITTGTSVQARTAPLRARRRRGTVALLGMLAMVLPLLAMAPPPASAATIAVGPVDPSTDFPLWVAGGSQRLDLCLDSAECLGTRAGLVAPDGEAFWFNASATVTGAASGLVEMATEAAFAGAGSGQEIAFNRIRIRLDVPEPGTYVVDYPYGSKTFTVAALDPQGRDINLTQDVGCLTPPCGAFAHLADSGEGGVGGSFLRWDPAVAPAAPAGFLGDGVSAHRVVGSPIGRNFVEVTRIGDAAGAALATPEVVSHVDTFAVQGKIARPQVLADPPSGSYPAAIQVALVASEPGAEIWYTTDGSAPADAEGQPSAAAQRYTAPVPVGSDLTLRAVNVVGGRAVTDPVTGQPAPASTHTYVVDTAVPTLGVTPDSGTYGSAQWVRMTGADTQDASPSIYYTRALVAPGGSDPADPTTSSTRYTGPVAVDGNLDGAQTVIKAIAVDAAGNVSAVARRAYTINAPSVSASPAGGSYGTAVDVRLSASDPEAAIYYSTNGQDPVVHQDRATGQVTGVENATPYTNDPVRLTGYTTLKFLAVSAAGQSTVSTEDYLIDIPANRAPGALAAVGPVDHANGYPFWYGDAGDPDAGLDPVRLELCLDDPLCPVVGELPDPSRPLSYPDNFPDEAFWWSGEAALTTPSGASALLVLAQEAAFGGAGNVAVGEQISFARLRIRIDNVAPGGTYTVTSPYGVDVVTADDRGRVFFTEDVGCLAAPCTFTEALDGRVGPFLRWDPAVGPAAPAGYVGNPLVEHEVVGSPHGTNFFRVEGPDIGGPGVDRVQTDLFVVQGRLAELRATASPQGGLYAAPQDVRLQASFPAEAKIVYTTDGSTPAVDPSGTVTNGQEYVPAPGDANAAAVVRVPEGATTLRFMAVDLASSATSPVYTEEYTVDPVLPTVTASPDPADGPFAGAQQVTLTSAAPDIVYTTDGTTPALAADGTPAGTTRAYSGPLTVGRPTTLEAAAVTASGTLGPVSTFVYDIHNLKAVGPTDPANGFPTWYQDHGSATLAPAKLELCLDDALCPVVGNRPDPTLPVSFPDNFPDESFWWAGDASFDAGATRARLVLAAEAAFANGAVTAGDQVAFARIRVRADNLVPGATYRVTHPYGTVRLTAGADGTIFHTDDSGCLSGPCDFSQMLRGPVGPFLRWDAGAPEGYLGDGVTPHRVVGSPYGTNEFRMEQVTTGTGSALASPVPLGGTDQFVVQGRLASLRVSASPSGGSFTTAQQVQLASNDPAAEIFYTTDGSVPSAASTRYTGPITVAGEGTTRLRFLAVAADGTTSPVGSETYTIDTVAPTVSADPAGGSFISTQQVTLSSDDPTAVIHYTTDGSTPTAASTRYDGPLQVSRSLTLRARAIDPLGNASAVGSWAFVLSLPTSSLTLGTPSAAVVDHGQSTALTGRLTVTGDGTPLPGRAVRVQSRPLGATAWADVPGATGTTGSDGGYLATLTPSATVDYRVVFAGDPSYQASVSPTQRVGVRAVVWLAPLVDQVRRGRAVTYSGTLAPTHAGAVITVTVSAPGQRTRNATATVAADGSWRVRTKAPNKAGSYSVVARWGGDVDHLAGTSQTRTLRVVR